MAPSLQITLFSLLIFTIARAQPSFRPSALVLPVKKNASTLQYVTTIHQRTPLVSENLLVDLGNRYMWVDCETNYVSSTYRPVRCETSQCRMSDPDTCSDCFKRSRAGCNNFTCGVFLENSVNNIAMIGEVAQDVVSVRSTDGSSSGRVVSVPHFIFSCAPSYLRRNLSSGAVGVAGLGRNKIGLPSQFASAFSFKRKFVMCLSGSRTSNGVIIFGNDPYKFLPNIIVSDKTLTYTPLLTNPESTSASSHGEPSVEYFIGVKSIKINSKIVSIDTSLLPITNGNGGTKISTINPYTVLEDSIYKAVLKAFIKESATRNITRVASVAPFGACFSTDNILSTRRQCRALIWCYRAKAWSGP